MTCKIGLIGCGTVGQGLLEILIQKKEYLKKTFDFDAKVVAISDMLKGSLLIPEGIDIERLLHLLEQGKRIDAYLEGKPNEAEQMDALQVIEQCDADIIAELTYTDIQTAEPATSHVKKALQTGKHVVTSNKGPATLFYDELKKMAEENNLFFRIEGTVMSGTPVFNLFEHGFSGNSIKEIKGILNGTTNFILSKMEEEGMDYEDALKLAQKLGYAEADPTADVEGFDALAKIVILSNVLLQEEKGSHPFLRKKSWRQKKTDTGINSSHRPGKKRGGLKPASHPKSSLSRILSLESWEPIMLSLSIWISWAKSRFKDLVRGKSRQDTPSWLTY
jgi:homoserine dehydrogenase